MLEAPRGLAPQNIQLARSFTPLNDSQMAELTARTEPIARGFAWLFFIVAAYNASIRDGQASGPNLPKTRLAMPIDTAPFHGFHPVRPAVNHTLGGLAVAVASDETEIGSGKIHEHKRTQLLAAGADLVIPDYECHAALVTLIFDER